MRIWVSIPIALDHLVPAVVEGGCGFVVLDHGESLVYTIDSFLGRSQSELDYISRVFFQVCGWFNKVDGSASCVANRTNR